MYENKKIDCSNELNFKNSVSNLKKENLSKIYEDKIRKSYSPVNRDNFSKKITKKDDVMREYI